MYYIINYCAKFHLPSQNKSRDVILLCINSVQRKSICYYFTPNKFTSHRYIINTFFDTLCLHSMNQTQNSELENVVAALTLNETLLKVSLSFNLLVENASDSFGLEYSRDIVTIENVESESWICIWCFLSMSRVCRWCRASSIKCRLDHILIFYSDAILNRWNLFESMLRRSIDDEPNINYAILWGIFSVRSLFPMKLKHTSYLCSNWQFEIFKKSKLRNAK